MRMCVGCGQMRPKMEMVRVVRTPEGRVVVDTTRSAKLAGRGAYVEPKEDCVAAACRANRLDRALEVAIPADVFEHLQRVVAQRVQTGS
ncbi:MAG: YlxR family protein [Armatimonadota bacterium]|nr:YlxR family protein [Armatimonadota bacterium]MDR5697572.1 YlxR family protein [Armatimonadota bacterium]